MPPDILEKMTIDDSRWRHRLRRSRRLACGFVALAFVLRAAMAFLGPPHFWVYTDYFEMAKNVVHGVGYCLGDDGTLCAYFPPVYPTIVAAGALTSHPVPVIVLISALLGAGTVLLTYLIGERLFGTAVGLLASGYAAVYPYYVWHDTVLQENATLAFVVAGAIYLLLQSGQVGSMWLTLAAGAAIGLTVLTKANLALFLVFAMAWTAVAYGARRFLWMALGAVLIVGPWVVRTWRITGEPILYSNGGFSLWTANHRLTFDYFPERRIDDAQVPEWSDLTPDEQREFDAISDPHWIKQTHWLWSKGMAFIRRASLADPAPCGVQSLDRLLAAVQSGKGMAVSDYLLCLVCPAARAGVLGRVAVPPAMARSGLYLCRFSRIRVGYRGVLGAYQPQDVSGALFDDPGCVGSGFENHGTRRATRIVDHLLPARPIDGPHARGAMHRYGDAVRPESYLRRSPLNANSRSLARVAPK